MLSIAVPIVMTQSCGNEWGLLPYEYLLRVQDLEEQKRTKYKINGTVLPYEYSYRYLAHDEIAVYARIAGFLQ